MCRILRTQSNFESVTRIQFTVQSLTFPQQQCATILPKSQVSMWIISRLFTIKLCRVCVVLSVLWSLSAQVRQTQIDWPVAIEAGLSQDTNFPIGRWGIRRYGWLINMQIENCVLVTLPTLWAKINKIAFRFITFSIK